jgi:hypothetical protein
LKNVGAHPDLARELALRIDAMHGPRDAERLEARVAVLHLVVLVEHREAPRGLVLREVVVVEREMVSPLLGHRIEHIG